MATYNRSARCFLGRCIEVRRRKYVWFCPPHVPGLKAVTTSIPLACSMVSLIPRLQDFRILWFTHVEFHGQIQNIVLSCRVRRRQDAGDIEFPHEAIVPGMQSLAFDYVDGDLGRFARALRGRDLDALACRNRGELGDEAQGQPVGRFLYRTKVGQSFLIARARDGRGSILFRGSGDGRPPGTPSGLHSQIAGRLVKPHH